MPEGDTLARTARSLRVWLAGRTLTEARGRCLAPLAGVLVGAEVAGVESRGKHLLVHLSTGGRRLVVHTHLQMTGSWHVYRAGETWRRPAGQARAVLVCADRVAVCFNAPTVEVLDAASLRSHPRLSRLGPDLLAEGVDLDEVVARARLLPGSTALGELLLDQRVAAGVGNIWRCEALHRLGLSPWAGQDRVDDATLATLFATAAGLMAASVEGTADGVMGRPRARVYRRAGRPCPTCGSLVASRGQGPQARVAYWCPTCQPG